MKRLSSSCEVVVSIVCWLSIAIVGCAPPPASIRDVIADRTDEFGATDAHEDTPPNADVTLRDQDADSGDNDTCERAANVSSGARLLNVSTTGATRTTDSCLPEALGSLRFYTINVPAAHLLEVGAVPNGSPGTIAVRIFDRCDGSCIDGARTRAQWFNASAIARTVVVAIGGVQREPIAFDAEFTTRPISVGDSCAAPTDINESRVVRIDSISGSARSTLCDGETGVARWFRVRIPAGFELSAQVLGNAATRIRVADSCAANACIANETASITVAQSAVERTVLLSVSPADDRSFDLAVDLSPPTVPGVCLFSAIFRRSTSLAGETTARGSHHATDCRTRTLQSLFYRVVVAPGQRLDARTNNANVLLRFLNACGASNCIDASSDLIINPRYINNTSVEQTIIVAASARDSMRVEVFDLTLTLATPHPASACATAPLVAHGASLSVSSEEFTNTALNCRFPEQVRSLFFEAAVASGQRLIVEGVRDTQVSLFDGCGGATCLGTVSGNSSLSTSTTAAWTNTGASTRRVIIALSHTTPPVLAFPVTANVRIEAPAPNGVCSTAPPFADGESIRGASTLLSGEGFRACSISDTASLYWRVTVPAGHRAVATMQPLSSALGVINLAFVADCLATSCLSSTSLPGSSSTTEPRVLGWSNTTSDPQSVILVAHGGATPFDLNLSIAPTVPQATCAGRASLLSGVTRLANRYADAVEPASNCMAGSPATIPSQFFEIEVPAGQRLSVAVASTVGHLTRILPSCGATSCLAPPANSGSPVTGWSNTDAAPRTVVVAVSRPDGATNSAGTYNITATLSPIPTNSRCSTPIPLSPGVVVSGSAADGIDSATNCSGDDPTALFYSIRVPAGQRLIATVSTTSTSGAFVRILQSCDARSCLGAAPSRTAYWTNTDAVARDVVVAVGPRYRSSTPSTFALTAAFETPATNGRCSSAVPVVAPSVITARPLDAIETTVACSPRSALYYSVTVPAQRRLRVSTTGVGSDRIAIQSGCAGMCLAQGDSTRSPMLWTNASATDATVTVAVSGDIAAELASQTMNVRFDVEAIPPAGACASAPSITAGSGTTVSLADAGEITTACGRMGASFPSLFHAVRVPSGQTMTATVSCALGVRCGIRLLSGCAPSMCLASWNEASTATASWRNSDSSDATAIVAVSYPDAAFSSPPAFASIEVALRP